MHGTACKVPVAEFELHACRLVKAGLLDKRHARQFALISAWGEMVGYAGNITLNCLRIAALLERETALTEELVRRKKVRQHMYMEPTLMQTAYALAPVQDTSAR